MVRAGTFDQVEQTMSINLEEMATTVQWLKDVEEIKQLKYRYGRYCDGGWARQGGTHMGPIADLFTEDGVWDSRPFMPVAKGREAIRNLFVELRKMPFASHQMTNPIIEVNGDRAKAYWRLLGASDLPGAKTGELHINAYEDEYERTAEGWRISYMLSVSGRLGIMTEGWASIGEEGFAPGLVDESAT
jgi:ketosteroid isomerase-like protein